MSELTWRDSADDSEDDYDSPNCHKHNLDYSSSSEEDMEDRGQVVDDLHAAISRQQLELIGSLIQGGASVNSVDPEQRTPLQVACSMEEPDATLIKCLLEHGATVNRTDAVGQTPLHIVLNHADATLALLQHGASVDATDGEGRTPLELATPPTNLIVLSYGASHCAGLACRNRSCRYIGKHHAISFFIFLRTIPLGEDFNRRIGQTDFNFRDLLELNIPRSHFEEILSTVSPKLLKSIFVSPYDHMLYCSYLKIKKLQLMWKCSSLFLFSPVQLPPEVTCHIFTHLDVGDLNSLLQIINSL